MITKKGNEEKIEEWEVEEMNHRLNDYLQDWGNVRSVDAQEVEDRNYLIVRYK